MLEAPAILPLLNSSERATLILFAVHNLLLRSGDVNTAKLVWVAYLETSEVTEALSDALDVECMLP